MIINRITEGMANTLLRQMGAVEIKNAPAYVNKVKFKLDEDTNATTAFVLMRCISVNVQMNRNSSAPSARIWK